MTIENITYSGQLSFYTYSVLQQVTGEHTHDQGDAHAEGADPRGQAAALVEFLKPFHVEDPQGHLGAHDEDVHKEGGEDHHPGPSAIDIWVRFKCLLILGVIFKIIPNIFMTGIHFPRLSEIHTTDHFIQYQNKKKSSPSLDSSTSS